MEIQRPSMDNANRGGSRFFEGGHHFQENWKNDFPKIPRSHAHPQLFEHTQKIQKPFWANRIYLCFDDVWSSKIYPDTGILLSRFCSKRSKLNIVWTHQKQISRKGKQSQNKKEATHHTHQNKFQLGCLPGFSIFSKLWISKMLRYETIMFFENDLGFSGIFESLSVMN